MTVSDPLRASAWARPLALACTGLLLGLTQGFGLYLVSNNLSAIQGSLGATAAEASWLVTAYFATALSSTLLLTKVRLHFGLRPFAIGGLLLFLLVSALFLLDVALALISLAAIAALPLSPQPRRPAFDRGDLLAFPLYAVGLALLCVTISQGRLQWWT
ncbi:MAG: hypothetical protein IIA03_11590, partial [Proteobacteria bacterium]|nr:hypothetical protein [Pseudomonadota bacterium]